VTTNGTAADAAFSQSVPGWSQPAAPAGASGAPPSSGPSATWAGYGQPAARSAHGAPTASVGTGSAATAATLGPAAASPALGKAARTTASARPRSRAKRTAADLRRLKIGDTFLVSVANQRLAFQVDLIQSLSDQHEAPTALPGRDHLTLVTDTPIDNYGSRLLVRGVRVPVPERAAQGNGRAVAHIKAGLPWWAVTATGALTVLTVIAVL